MRRGAEFAESHLFFPVNPGERSLLLSSRNRAWCGIRDLDDEAAVSHRIGYLCEVPALRFASAGATAVITLSPVIPAKRHGGCRGARAGIRKPHPSVPLWVEFFPGSRIARCAGFRDDLGGGVIPGERSETRNPESTLIDAVWLMFSLDSGSVLRTVRNDTSRRSLRLCALCVM